MRQLAITLKLLLVLYLLATCGGQSQRERTIKATLVAVNQARDAFIAFDSKTQDLIADTAPSVARGMELFAAYRAKRELVVKAFELAYRAIAIAATANDDPSFKSMLDAVRAITKAYENFQKDKHAP